MTLFRTHPLEMNNVLTVNTNLFVSSCFCNDIVFGLLFIIFAIFYESGFVQEVLIILESLLLSSYSFAAYGSSSGSIISSLVKYI